MMDGTADVPRQSEYAALATARHGDPFAVLGPHEEDGRWTVTAFLPQARSVMLTAADGSDLAKMQRIHGDGIFRAVLDAPPPRDYRFSLDSDSEGNLLDDPYRFGPVLGELDIHLLTEGRHQRAYDVMGGQLSTHEGTQGARFVVWAPNAARVSVVGAFNDWDGRRHPMRKRQENGCWELFVPGLAEGAPYKYEILSGDGRLLPLKADPFAYAAEKTPKTASVLTSRPARRASPEWLRERTAHNAPQAPITVYEVHLGSWMRSETGAYLTYDELAERLIPYAAEMGFTHLEFLPVSEFPFDGSWGYQPVGLYAPTSRHGDPAAFARLVEKAQEAGLGVILDWVPGHFPSDPHGLAEFDGTHLYEHADPRQGFHQDWNTLIFNYGRSEVRNFLEANALFWIDQYGIDGLRVDAVASMLYLDYSRREGEWIPNHHGGRENLEAIEFLQSTNALVDIHHHGAVTIAEESTAFPGVTAPTKDDGLGFNYKWNMGWMHDSLSYMQTDPLYRSHHHDQMTFSLVYAFSERFILPLSHDEVVHGKGSLIGKMPGDRWQKFANLRAYFGFMWTHPGKKLLFMGGEFAQDREWNHDRGLDWHLLDEADHAGVQKLVRDLNRLYRQTPALHRHDTSPEGFAWVIGDDRENAVFAYLRRGANDAEVALVVANMTPRVREDYRVGVPQAGRWIRTLSTDASKYGGSGVGEDLAEAEPTPWNGQPASVRLTLPPLATVIFTPEGLSTD